MNPAHLLAGAHASFIDSVRILADHGRGAWRHVGGVFSFATDLPIALFNGCIVVQPARAEDVEESVAWIRSHDVPFGVWIDERLAPLAAAGAERAGLQRRAAPYPAMGMGPIPEAPPAASGVTVRAVTGDDLVAYYALQEAGGTPADLARRAIPPAFAADPRVRVFVAELDGDPVGNAIAIRTGSVLGVYAVGTLPSARGRGVASAATWACLQAGRSWGCDMAVLQSSAMAMSMYRRMGFQDVVAYAVYTPPPRDGRRVCASSPRRELTPGMPIARARASEG